VALANQKTLNKKHKNYNIGFFVLPRATQNSLNTHQKFALSGFAEEYCLIVLILLITVIENFDNYF
jgi:hypothetical protein